MLSMMRKIDWQQNSFFEMNIIFDIPFFVPGCNIGDNFDVTIQKWPFKSGLEFKFSYLPVLQ